MNFDRLFFRVNAVFCIYLGLILFGKGVSQWRNSWVADIATQDMDKYLDLLLRHVAQQSAPAAVFVGSIPALLLISLVLTFYLYLIDRSRRLSLVAFLFGTALAGLWISRRFFGAAISVTAAKYIESSSVVTRESIMAQAKNLYFYDSLSQILSSGSSLVSYGLFGILLMRGKGLEFIVGLLFITSSLVLMINQIFAVSSLDTLAVLILPALAFGFSGVLFWKYEAAMET